MKIACKVTTIQEINKIFSLFFTMNILIVAINLPNGKFSGRSWRLYLSD